jgi:hypothetical protein
MVSKKIFTPPLKTNRLFPVSYSKFHYPCIQTHIFLKLTLSPPQSFLLLSPKAFSSSIEFLLLRSSVLMKPWIELSFSPFNSLSPEGFSSIEVLFLRKLSPHEAMACLMFEGVGVGVGLMFERVDFRSDLGFIWVWEWFQI